MRSRPARATLLCLVALAASPLPAAAAGGPRLGPPPPAPRRPVVQDVQGTRVVDDYRWMEDAASPEVKAWSDAQNARARAYLDALPDAARVRARVDQLVRSSSIRYFGLEERGGLLFGEKFDPTQQQPLLVTLRSADDPASERTVLDLNALDPQGGTSMDFWVPSLDGARVAVSLSRGGSEDGELHVYDVAQGRDLGEVVPRVNYGTAGGSVAWLPGGESFLYTRYPAPGERPPEDVHFWQQVWRHRLGSPQGEDVQELAEGLPRIAEIALRTTRDGRWVVADVQNGDGGEHAFYVRAEDGRWVQATRFADRVVDAAPGEDGNLYLLSVAAPRGRVLRVPIAAPELARAEPLVPEGEPAIQRLVVTRGRLYTVDEVGGPMQIRAFSLDGEAAGTLPLEPVAAVTGLTRADDGDDLLVEQATYLSPPAWHRYDAAAGAAHRTALFQTSVADFSDAEVVREYATSRDGTRVPMSVVRRKGTRLDGRNPVLLYGYGGYGVSTEPRFSSLVRAWLDQGGVWVDANLRGGGEFGEDWHRQGNLTRKQNVFDDFHACALRLLALRYTTPARLAILGGSNGGLLMGAALVQHPESYRAVVAQVGIFDMVRVEETSNGAFNVTEFGSVKDPDQAKALLAYSPYHHVRKGVRYPAVLLMTGANDPRVDPWHSRKFTARLQAASASGRPVLLRTTDKAGHGIGSALDEVIAERADLLSFLFQQLGMRWRPPAVTPPAG
jgi:prolyl oligopeptidase